MTPEEKAVLKLLQEWSPDVTTLLKQAGYFSPAMSEVTKEEIAAKIGFGKGGRLYNKIKAASAEKNWEIAKIVINEESLIELKQGARQVAKDLGIPFSEYDWNPVAQKYFKEEGLKLVKILTATDLKRLKGQIQTHFGLNERTFARKYGESYSCAPYRMRTIFRTEKFRAINAGEYLEAKEVGALTKTWQHSQGPNPRKQHLAMTGETVGIDELFSDGEQYPQMVNCRCRVNYGFGSGKNWTKSKPPVARKVAPIEEAPRKVAEFVPAKSYAEANAWAKARGLDARWGDSPLYAKDGTPLVNLDTINATHARLDHLMAAYPNSGLKKIGATYYDDLYTYEKDRAAYIAKQRANAEAKGKLWSDKAEKAALKKWGRQMPTVSTDSFGFEYDPFVGGQYFPGESGGTIRLNHFTPKRASIEQDALTRLEKIKSGKVLDSTGGSIENLITHEFGHALDDRFNIAYNPKMRALFDSLTDEEIVNGLSNYAASRNVVGDRNILEFIAEGFAESFYENPRPIGAKVRAIVDEIIKEASS